ncbi:MAG: nuclease A inhibitor family protein [Rudanella sp.]|nr:nuclease A inhibitor family protein [Rudanella sp.]
MTKKPRKSNTSANIPETPKTETVSETRPADMPSALEQTIKPLIADLLYPSESDEPLTYVTCYLKQESCLTGSQIEEWLMLPPAVFVEEVPETNFWKPVTRDEEWYGEEEKKRSVAFWHLQQEIEKHLSTRQVFRVGDTEIDIYLLGRTTEGSRAGLKTRVVET